MRHQDTPDWSILEHLRQRFLNGFESLAQDYWDSDEQLLAYDTSFAQRIGWKWDAVLGEIQQRALPPSTWLQEMRPALLDFGCGTGIATRRVLAAWGDQWASQVILSDRSRRAQAFAKKTISLEFPRLAQDIIATPSTEPTPPRTPYILLASHVLSELAGQGLEQFFAIAASATVVVLVEPGTPLLAGAVGRLREHLRRHGHRPVAPCPHAGPCGMLAEERQGDWCHNFAKPPSHIFRDAYWGEFSRRLKIDLRSLPVSFLVSYKNELALSLPPSSDQQRLLGRASCNKAGARFVSCSANGIRESFVAKRHNKTMVKELDDGPFTYLFAETAVDSLPNEEF